MSFICNNSDCSAPDNKKNKSYPSAMECPFCDAPLIEVVAFSEEETSLINNLPYVIAYPLQKTLKEKHAWTKINLLKDICYICMEIFDKELYHCDECKICH